VSLNLPLPPLSSAADLFAPAPANRRPRCRVTLHPRYAAWLRKAGLDSAEAILELTGEIVGGHPDRHVSRVELPTSAGMRVLFLKREHTVGWRVRLKNYRAGFGWVSRCEREATTLQSLEACGLPGPQWLAYGTSDDGRAFLLVDALAGSVDLKTMLKDNRLSESDRRKLATSLGRSLAELHATGFAPPDFSAKHVFVDRGSARVTLVDWQSAPQPGLVAIAQRVHGFALLHATIPENQASPRERLRALREYLRALSAECRPNWKDVVRAVQKASKRFGRSSSVRDQNGDARIANDLRLVWLAGEAVCVVPELVKQWPSPPIAPPFYPGPSDSKSGPSDHYIGLPDGRTATLTRHTTLAPFGRLLARLRGRSWRSPAAVAARILFQLQRFDAPAPRLLAFGQRLLSPGRADSFVLTDQSPGAVPLADWLARPFPGPLDRFLFLRRCGRTLRALHDAEARFSRTSSCLEPLVVDTAGGEEVILINAPETVERARRLTDRDRFADMQRVLYAVHDTTTKADRLRVVLGYLDDTGGLPKRWRRAVAKLIRN
jgi:hypothetical protein